MTQTICPYCNEELGFEDICWNSLKKYEKETNKVIYYCPKCRKILGFSNK
ncbi:MAG: hypothetical protein HZR80_03030 [Candidatus Heimdallarchaeota archaeon]